MNIAWLKDNPPSKNPYFLLPDAKFLLEPAPIVPLEVEPKFLTVRDIFGSLVKMNDPSQAAFLMRLISYSTFEPNFQGMADALNVHHGSNVQRRFKDLVVKAGFQVTDENRIAIKAFDFRKDNVADKVISEGTSASKDRPAVDAGSAPATGKTKAKDRAGRKPKEPKKPRSAKEGTAKVKKPKAKPSKATDSNAPKVIRKRKIVKKVKDVGKSKDKPKANPKLATVEEVPDVEMGGGTYENENAEVLVADI